MNNVREEEKVAKKASYTTNAIESLNFSVRKITKNQQSFPTTDAAMKLAVHGLAKHLKTEDDAD